MTKAGYWKSDRCPGAAVVISVVPFNCLSDPVAGPKRRAYAVAHAHKQSIVHREIKPADITCEPESDSSKVTDFGIVRITDSSKTRTGMVLDAPSCRSPEQLSRKKVEGRSDLYSVAVSLYRLPCGSLPFVGESDIGL